MNHPQLFEVFFSLLDREMSPPALRNNSKACYHFWRERYCEAAGIEGYTENQAMASYAELPKIFLRTYNAMKNGQLQ